MSGMGCVLLSVTCKKYLQGRLGKGRKAATAKLLFRSSHQGEQNLLMCCPCCHTTPASLVQIMGPNGAHGAVNPAVWKVSIAPATEATHRDETSFLGQFCTSFSLDIFLSQKLYSD